MVKVVKKISIQLLKRLRGISLVVFDFEGVFTNGLVMISQNGTESIICNRRDSWGLHEIKRLGIKIVVINEEPGLAVEKRCQKLKLECKLGFTKDKLTMFKEILAREQIKPKYALYMGDDLVDLPCLKYAGSAITVADGAPECKKRADYITSKSGGQGAIRELCELILKARGSTIIKS